MSIKVSVIVPVYNVEKYLGKCLDSLVSQTLRDIEIIVVNDGSPDGSQDIIDKFAAAYPDKIVTLKQKNQGPGAARNFGARHACGKYIGFVDSDDWARQDMFELLYKTAAENDADVVICDINKMVETDGECAFSEVWQGGGEYMKTVAEFVLASAITPAAWNKLFRREAAQSVPFLNIGFAEDLATTPVILSHCRKIAYLPQPLYFYLKRDGAMTTQRNNPKRAETIKAWERCLRDCNAQYREEIGHAIYRSFLNALLTERDFIDEYMGFFQEYKEFFRQNKYIRHQISKNSMDDLFGSMDTPPAQGDALCPQAKTLVEFMQETSPLLEQLDSLPRDMLAELFDMYNNTMEFAAENAASVGARLLVQLYNSRERIGEKLSSS